MVEVAFFVGAIGALGGAIAVVLLRNPFYSVLALVIHLVFLAGIFLLLRAQFLAAAQIVVYAGAVMVIYVFVAAYVGGIEEARFDAAPQLKVIGPILALALFVEISIAVLGSSLSELGKEGADVAPLLTPCPPAWLAFRKVSTLVNSPRNDSPQCIQESVPQDFGSIFDPQG